MGDRTALLMCCSRKEAEEVRRRAKLNRRSMSGYILFIVFRHIAIDRGNGASGCTDSWGSSGRRSAARHGGRRINGGSFPVEGGPTRVGACQRSRHLAQRLSMSRRAETRLSCSGPIIC
jgi:hypothetical protein